MLEEPNFKVYTDFDTPSGDASLLRDQENPEGSVLNSTEISSLGDSARPEPNLSAITTTQTPNTDITGNPPQPQPVQQPSLSVTAAPSEPSCTSQPGSTGIPCDLCGQYVKGQAYLAQHRNKKKCQDRQRVRKQLQDQLEASVDRMESLRVSESDTSAEPANSSKVKSNCQNPNSTTLQILFT